MYGAYGGMGMGGAYGQGYGGMGGMGAYSGGMRYGDMGQDGQGAGTSGKTRPHDFVEGKLFLGGLDAKTTKDSLAQYCQHWGELSDHVLMEGRGFGFITFADPASAQAFLETREHVIDGKRIEAKAAVARNADGTNTLTKKMFVGGTGEIADEDFKAYFEQFGEIEDFVVLRRPDGLSRGFGFVTFADEMSVEKCLVKQHSLNGKPVELKRAVKKEAMGSTGSGAGGPVRSGRSDWGGRGGDSEMSGRSTSYGGSSSYGGDRAAAASWPMSMAMTGYGMGMPGMNPYMMGYGMGGMGMGMGGMGMAGMYGAYGNMRGQYGRSNGDAKASTGSQSRYKPY